ADAPECAADIVMLPLAEIQVGQLRFAYGADGRRVEGFLVSEVTVHRELGDAGLGGNGVHAGAFETAAQEQQLSRLQNGRAFRRVFRPARSRAGGRLFGHCIQYWTGGFTIHTILASTLIPPADGP